MLCTLARMDEAIVAIAIGCGAMIAVVSIVSSAIRSMYIARMTEQSRREIAAYIAEGSMTPDEGARLMATNPPKDKSCG